MGPLLLYKTREAQLSQAPATSTPFCAPLAGEPCSHQVKPLLLQAKRPGWDRNGGTKWVKRACSADARKRHQARLGHRARSHLGSPLPSVTCPLGCRISLQVAPRSQASRAQRCSWVCCSAVIKQVFPGHQTGARHQGNGGWRDG